MTSNVVVAVESIIGPLVFKLLEMFRKALASSLKPFIPWDRVNVMLITLMKCVFGDRILIRVAIEGLRFNIRWPSLDLEVLKEVIKKKCYCLIPGSEPGEGKIVIDLGAYIGAYTVYIAMKGAYVIAVEPATPNLKLLIQNIRLNNVKNRVKIFKVAISSFRRRIKFPIESLDLNLGSFSLHREKSTWLRYEEVATITMDDLITIARTNRIDVVKIDVEGGEVDAIRGANELIKRYKPMLIFEVHGLCNLYKLLSLLRHRNYIVIRIISVKTVLGLGEELYYLYALPKDSEAEQADHTLTIKHGSECNETD